MAETLIAPAGVSRETLDHLLERHELPGFVSRARRVEAFERYERLRAGRARPGRYWKIDLDALDLHGAIPQLELRAEVTGAEAAGIICCDLQSAALQHGDIFRAAFGSALAATPSKFAELTTAFVSGGLFIHIPAGVVVDEPIRITYRLEAGSSFPYTLVHLGAGAHGSIIEHLVSDQSGVLAFSVAEVIASPGAHAAYACIQELPPDARAFHTRAALPDEGATMAWGVAEIGAALAVSSIDVDIRERGVTAELSALFFPSGDQHVDMITTVDHRVGDAQSHTVVKSAASGSGQARYLGNIRIRPDAHGTEATLRDDALLLSPHAHIDSVPALEIAANDVKAFHGATVGAIDEEVIFYMTTRGLDRATAERTIALGFFEPVVSRFPSERLRTYLSEALQKKVTR
ncbi:MAG: Fe-S cluster assembly protein SufD [Vulcanimicrobiaceae bacterium]